ALLFGHLQIQSMVGARVTSQVHRRPNATLFTPALTHGGTYNQSAYRPVVTNFTRAAVAPNLFAPAKNYQPAFQAPSPTQNRTLLQHTHNQGVYGATGPVGVPAQTGYVSNGWVVSNYSQPAGWFLPNTPAVVGLGSHGNGTFYPTSNQTAVSGRGKSNNPYANLSI
ncbi:hypothetical protein KR059_006261, partial [Drosophila kikkawai]